ncbi:DUF7282 domain-containing protein [Persicimonas caeni]|uniref:DUF7282 domain-containing protein n=1 Tax=Persicimonas caeni TaxID=2292766 RepID=UPI00143D028C|nr:hypothetical protein [Persicimonas caeni]
MKRRVLLTILLAMTVGVGACGDDDDATNNANNTNNQADTGTEDAGTEDTGAEDTGDEDAGDEDAGDEDTGDEDAGTEDTGTEDTGGDTTAAATADDQTLDNLSTLVTVASATSDGPGWIVIHENACTDDQGTATFGAVIGKAALSDGENTDISVTLERPAVDDESLCAMLHSDTGEEGTYEFGTDDLDGPVTDGEGNVVMDSFAVQVPEGTPAIRITIDASGNQDYDFQSVEPAMYDNGLSGSADPVLFLNDGWRYEIVNNATANHPFELLDADGGLGGMGDVLLSQASNPTAETDPDTAWNEDGNSVLFTVAGEAFAGGALSGSVDAYRCANHPESMQGTVTIESP